MRLRLPALLLLTLLLPSASSAAPLVLDFEDLANEESLTTQYAGLTFSNAIVLTAGISLNEFDFPPFSGANALSDSGGPIEIQFASSVLSFGAFFTYAAPVTLTAFDAGHHVVATASSLFASNLALDLGSVPNEFIEVLAATGIWGVAIDGGPYVLDDATLGSLGPASVPEPGTLSLALLGSVGVALWRRKWRTQARVDNQPGCGNNRQLY